MHEDSERILDSNNQLNFLKTTVAYKSVAYDTVMDKCMNCE